MMRYDHGGPKSCRGVFFQPKEQSFGMSRQQQLDPVTLRDMFRRNKFWTGLVKQASSFRRQFGKHSKHPEALQ